MNTTVDIFSLFLLSVVIFYVFGLIWIFINRKNLRIIRNKKPFFNIVLPLFISTLIGLVFYFAIKDWKFIQNEPELGYVISFFLGILISILTYIVQRGFIVFAFSKAFLNFIDDMTNRNVIIVEFFQRILGNCIDTQSFFKLLSENDIEYFKKITDELHTSGIEMSNQLYLLLLISAKAAKPKKHFAIWNTFDVPTNDEHEVEKYCEEYSQFYNSSNLNEKYRVFITDNIATLPNFNTIKEYHFNEWNFEKIHYCTREQLQNLLNKPEFNDFNDFVLLEKRKRGWVIGKIGLNGQKTIFKENETLFKEVKEFYSNLITMCERKNQVITN